MYLVAKLQPDIFLSNRPQGICCVQAHCRKMRGNCLQPFILQSKWRVFFNRSSMFRKINVSNQSISSSYMFVRMISTCFITNIRHFFCLCRKYRNYAEDADFRELCRSALPHPVIFCDLSAEEENLFAL